MKQVWNYVENFDNVAMPVPNWRVVGRTLQTLQELQVDGYFGEATQAVGGPACTCSAS